MPAALDGGVDAQFEVERRQAAQPLILRVKGAVDVQLETQAGLAGEAAIGDGVQAVELFAVVQVHAVAGERQHALGSVRLDEADLQIKRQVVIASQRRVEHTPAKRLKNQGKPAAQAA